MKLKDYLERFVMWVNSSASFGIPVMGYRPALLAIGLLIATLSHASEPILAYSYVAEAPPQGATEISQQVTYRQGKSEGTYDLWETRTEFERAITNRWLVAAYLNTYHVTAENNNSQRSRNDYTSVGDGDEVSGGGPATFGSYVPAIDTFPVPAARYENAGVKGFSIESIYQFMSPFTDPIGLSGYVEYSHGSNETEYEMKLLAQKNLMDGRLILVANTAIEFEKESWSRIVTEKEAKIVLSGGASYQIDHGWRVGLEGVNERGYKGGYRLSSDHRDYSAWFLGPTVHWANLQYFATLSWQHQLPMAEAYSTSAKNELVGDRSYAANEKNQFRLIFGHTF
jgi:hypothetical protein